MSIFSKTARITVPATDERHPNWSYRWQYAWDENVPEPREIETRVLRQPWASISRAMFVQRGYDAGSIRMWVWVFAAIVAVVGLFTGILVFAGYADRRECEETDQVKQQEYDWSYWGGCQLVTTDTEYDRTIEVHMP